MTPEESGDIPDLLAHVTEGECRHGVDLSNDCAACGWFHVDTGHSNPLNLYLRMPSTATDVALGQILDPYAAQVIGQAVNYWRRVTGVSDAALAALFAGCPTVPPARRG